MASSPENLREPGNGGGRVAVFSALWVMAVGAGVVALAKHGGTPGRAAGASVPKSIAPTTSVMRLMMFLHPKCPCSKASVAELSALMDHCGNRVAATVIVYQPAGEPPDWSRTATVADAGRIPGVTVQFDQDAVLARRYGAQTSGQVLLFDRAGTLRFAGGITGARGHVGDNDGLTTVEKIVDRRIDPAVPIVGEPVFGCPIYSADDDPGIAPKQDKR